MVVAVTPMETLLFGIISQSGRRWTKLCTTAFPVISFIDEALFVYENI
jgi:hypothetical protein